MTAINEVKENVKARDYLRVYRKEGKWGDWYSATRSDGKSINVCFDSDLSVPDLKAFEITNVVGTLKKKLVERNDEVYENYTYYVNSCEFRKIQGETMPL